MTTQPLKSPQELALLNQYRADKGQFGSRPAPQSTVKLVGLRSHPITVPPGETMVVSGVDMEVDIDGGSIAVTDSSFYDRRLIVGESTIARSTIAETAIAGADPDLPCEISDSSIWNSSLENATVSDSTMRNTALLDVSLRDASLAQCTTGEKTSESAETTRRVDWDRVELSDVSASSTSRFGRFRGVSGVGFVARGAVFRHGLEGCSLAGLDLSSARIQSGIKNSTLEGGLRETTLDGTAIVAMKHVGQGYGVSCIQATINDSQLAGDYRGGKFQGSIIQGGTLSGAFRGSNFTGATITDGRSQQVTPLTGDFTDARFHRARLGQTSISPGSIFDPRNPSRNMEYTPDTEFPHGFNPASPNQRGRWVLVRQ